MTLPDLIAKLESATGPSRELDWDIALAVGAVIQRETPSQTWFFTPGLGAFLGVPKGQAGEFGAASHQGHGYTFNAVDALTLIPDQLFWLTAKGKTRPDEPMYGCQVLSADGRDTVIAEAEHDVLAIAIASAALRARLAKEQQNAAAK